MRLLVCGGRDFINVPLIWRTLDEINAMVPVEVVIEGASDDVTGPYKGADFWAHQWAVLHDIETVRVHAAWRVFGRSAGPERNKRMLDEYHPDVVLAFPGGAGTRNMVTLAKEAGVEVRKVNGVDR